MFGQRLNQVRKLRGYTALQMSQQLSVSLRTYRNYESEHSYPSLDVLVQIADSLSVPTDYLLCRDDYLQSLGVSSDGFL